MVVFIDEIDTVRSLPFSTDEFFAAIRECYNRRTEDPVFGRLTFCLLGVATPADLIRDSRTTPFNIGRRIELSDFTVAEAAPLAHGLADANPVRSPRDAQSLLERILHWTNGHPYLTQRLLRALAEAPPPARLSRETVRPSSAPPEAGSSAPGSPVFERVDRLCEELFLDSRARERDDNLLFVRERILRSEVDLSSLLGLYEQVRNAVPVRDDDANDLINHLRLSGIVGVLEGQLVVRNRIYHHVFDLDWVAANMPDAELEKPNGDRVRIRRTCSIGRSPSNDLALLDDKVSRRHALIQVQKQQEFWLVDLGSSNGTYLNGRRVTQPILLHDQDQIDLGPFRLRFHQPQSAHLARTDQTTCDK
ncbi:MAG: FHA domain-containing protein, partial [Phycisphaerales bacterium]|nr:FHA domain-containing protein [Phycisphaerales bacterium]